MLYEVQRMYDGGRLVPKHVRAASMARGTLTVAQERDPQRRRAVLVARLLSPGPKPQIPPLYDVVLVASTGSTWSLAGVERMESGPLHHEHVVAQAWYVEPASTQELIDAEQRWSQAAGRVHELEQQLIQLGQVPVTKAPSRD